MNVDREGAGRRTYMLVERFRDGDPRPVYERLRAQGRGLPEGLAYVASWVDVDLRCCFQVMETSDPDLLEEWMRLWSDLVAFEVHEVLGSEEAAVRALGSATPEG